ncbi:MAG: hypothetical protein AAGD40_00780 [Pseudomonadota bacterium]
MDRPPGYAPFRQTIETVGDHQLPVVRRGPGGTPGKPLVVFAQPLFEELNRCRRLTADIGDALAALGIESACPDLPRTGNHADGRPFDMEIAVAALNAFLAAHTDRRLLVLSLRGGALLVPPDEPHLAIAPVRRGERVLTDLKRTQQVGDAERTGGAAKTETKTRWAAGEAVHLAGYVVTAATARALSAARLDQNIGTDDEIAATMPPVWRQADPVRVRDAARRIAALAQARLS